MLFHNGTKTRLQIPEGITALQVKPTICCMYLAKVNLLLRQLGITSLAVELSLTPNVGTIKSLCISGKTTSETLLEPIIIDVTDIDYIDIQLLAMEEEAISNTQKLEWDVTFTLS